MDGEKRKGGTERVRKRGREGGREGGTERGKKGGEEGGKEGLRSCDIQYCTSITVTQ